jgi:hypothetical protein
MSPPVAVPQKSGFMKKLLHIVSALFFVAFSALWMFSNIMGNRPILSAYRTHLYIPGD